MARMLTANVFVTAMLAGMTLAGRRDLTTLGTELDSAFAGAYEDLIGAAPGLGISVDFSLWLDPYHGDSATLRDALHYAHEIEIVRATDSTMHDWEILIGEEEARERIARGPLPAGLVSAMVKRYLTA